MRLKLTKTAVDKLAVTAQPYDVYDTEQPGLVFRIESTGTRSWYFAFRINGNRRRYKIGGFPGVSVDGARVLARKLAGKVADGIDVQAEREIERVQAARDRVSTLKAFLNYKYEPWALAHLKTGQEQLDRIRADFKGWLDKPMGSLSPFLVEGWRRTELKRGTKPTTINRNFQRVRAVLSRAVEWGDLDHHPLATVKPIKTDKRGRVRFLSQVEEEALREALHDRENELRAARDRFNQWRRKRGVKELPKRKGDFVDHLRPMVLLALNTGMRRGELLSLQWRHVNLSGKTITVVAATAKSGQTRYLPLNGEAVALLKGWRAHNEPVEPDDYVFAVRRGKRMGSVSTAWDSVATAAKLDEFRFHDLRHTFASNLVMSGVPLNTVRELLGHTSMEMTIRYSHLAPDNLASAVEKLPRVGT